MSPFDEYGPKTHHGQCIQMVRIDQLIPSEILATLLVFPFFIHPTQPLPPSIGFTLKIVRCIMNFFTFGYVIQVKILTYPTQPSYWVFIIEDRAH